MRWIASVTVLALFAMLASCATEPTTSGHITVTPKPIKSVFNIQSGNPTSDTLYTIYPNPFSRANGDTAVFLQFGIPDSAQVILLIQNPIGDEVAQFTDTSLHQGTYNGTWQPVGAGGAALNPGVYFVTLRVNDTLQHKGYINSQVLNISDN